MFTPKRFVGILFYVFYIIFLWLLWGITVFPLFSEARVIYVHVNLHQQLQQKAIPENIDVEVAQRDESWP
jgi:formate-dependent nitrite reductase membrane component NrfD